LTSYRFLAHENFVAQWLEFIEQKPEASDAALHHFVQCKEHPDSGRQMHNIPNPALTGRLFRHWVQGPGGFRFAHFFDSTTGVVLPVFITSDIRSNFDWDKAPWAEIAGAIVSDWLGKRSEAFTEFRLPKAT
jgi:hypothetical protein